MAQLRYSTLEIVNKVLNALDLQPVSTLGETEDSEMVLELVDTAYIELDLSLNWLPRKTTVRLNSSSGTGYDHTVDNWLDSYPDVPWSMKLPDGVEEVIKVYYNNRELRYISPSEMLYKIEKTIANKTTGDPKFWTSGMMDEDYIYFDSVDTDVEVALVSTKAECYVTKYDTTVKLSTDTQTINLTEKAIETLINTVIGLGFYTIIGNKSLGDTFMRRASVAKNKLLRQSRKTKPRKFHPNDIDFSYKPNTSSSGNRFIDSSDYIEV